MRSPTEYQVCPFQLPLGRVHHGLVEKEGQVSSPPPYFPYGCGMRSLFPDPPSGRSVTHAAWGRYWRRARSVAAFVGFRLRAVAIGVAPCCIIGS